MNIVFKNQRELVDRIKRELQLEEERLKQAINKCPHRWSDPIADHKYHESYLIKGDPPGVGGSDHQCDCWVPAKTEKRWKRVCAICGEVEYTSNVTQHVTETPTFS